VRFLPLARLAVLALPLIASPASYAVTVLPGQLLSVSFTVTAVPLSPILQDYPYDTISLIVGAAESPGVGATIYDGSTALGTSSQFGPGFYWGAPGSIFGTNSDGLLLSFPFVQGFVGRVEVRPTNTALSFDATDMHFNLGRGLVRGFIRTEGGTEVTIDGFEVRAVPEPSTWMLLLSGFLGLFVLAGRRQTHR